MNGSSDRNRRNLFLISIINSKTDIKIIRLKANVKNKDCVPKHVIFMFIVT